LVEKKEEVYVEKKQRVENNEDHFVEKTEKQ
jgi:hypothetical protein